LITEDRYDMADVRELEEKGLVAVSVGESDEGEVQ
jgi:hypothetical protein